MNDEIPFIFEICERLATISSGRFNFSTGNTNLKIGELVRGTDGVFVTDTTPPPPDMYTPIEYYQIDFIAVNRDSALAFEDLQIIYDLFHQAINYTTDNFEIYYSHAIGQPQDLDRDAEGRKLLRLSILYIVRSLIS